MRFLVLIFLVVAVGAVEPCRIEVVERESGWAVPMVELRTTHGLSFWSDNNGLIACDAPELMDREVWFGVHGHGYEVKKDGFGLAGVRVVPKPGKTVRVEVERTNIARRLGRITRAGIFAESQKLGLEMDWVESGVFGADSVQNAVYGGKMYWAWGDTSLANYPLGIFDASSATSAVRPFEKLEPPIQLRLDYFRDERGKIRGVAKIPGPGPTWLFGYTSLLDKNGRERLVSTYTKINPPLEAYERGLCVWDDGSNSFTRLKTIWTKRGERDEKPLFPEGQPAHWKDEEGKEWLLFGNPLPHFRCPPTFEAWQDTNSWEELKPQKNFKDADGKTVEPHTGQIVFSKYRGRWVGVFMEKFGKPSAFGELWYVEADSPLGPWGVAVKIVSHNNYSFYNPRLHPEFADSDKPVLIFEATYTAEFADRPHPTPRANYNQVIYRLDLDEARLAPAKK